METEEEYPFHIYIIAVGLFQLKMPEVLHRATITGGLYLLLGLCTVWSDMTHTIIGCWGRVESRILSQPQLKYNVTVTVVGGWTRK